MFFVGKLNLRTTATNKIRISNAVKFVQSLGLCNDFTSSAHEHLPRLHDKLSRVKILQYCCKTFSGTINTHRWCISHVLLWRKERRWPPVILSTFFCVHKTRYSRLGTVLFLPMPKPVHHFLRSNFLSVHESSWFFLYIDNSSITIFCVIRSKQSLYIFQKMHIFLENFNVSIHFIILHMIFKSINS